MPIQNVAETHETAPIQPAGTSARVGDENVMAGQTVLAADALLVPPGPVTASVRLYFCAVAPASAGKVKGTETRAGTEPATQGVVTGRPATAGIAETVQLFERLTIADKTVAPPAEGRSAGCTAILAIAGGASRSTTVTGLAVVVPPEPFTVKPNLYAFLPAVWFAGTRTVCLTTPLEQETFAGSPPSAGDDVKVQVLARLTDVLSWTLPPAAGSDVGLARKYSMAGRRIADCAALAGSPDASKLSAAPDTESTAAARTGVTLNPIIFLCSIRSLLRQRDVYAHVP